MNTSIDMNVDTSRTAVVMTVHGDIDHTVRADAEAAVSALPSTARDITLALADVAFMDVEGLHLIDVLDRYTCRVGGRLSVTGLSSQPGRLLRMAGDMWPQGQWRRLLPTDAAA